MVTLVPPHVPCRLKKHRWSYQQALSPNYSAWCAPISATIDSFPGTQRRGLTPRQGSLSDRPSIGTGPNPARGKYYYSKDRQYCDPQAENLTTVGRLNQARRPFISYSLRIVPFEQPQYSPLVRHCQYQTKTAAHIPETNQPLLLL